MNKRKTSKLSIVARELDMFLTTYTLDNRKLADAEEQESSKIIPEIHVVKTLKKECNMESLPPKENSDAFGSTSYFKQQRKVEENPKLLAANFAAQAIRMLANALPSEVKPFSDGSVVYLDGGSSSVPFWEEFLRPKIINGEYARCWVYTNNLYIFNDYLFGKENESSSWNNFRVLGEEIDKDHACMNGDALVTAIKNANFRPTALFIGTRGLEFTEEGQIYFACHGNNNEIQAKQAYLEAKASVRLILGSPKKCGLIDGLSFDITEIKNIGKAPIAFVTTEPLPSSEEFRPFQRAKDIFNSPSFRKALDDKGIRFVWFIIKAKEGAETVPELKEIITPNQKLEQSLTKQLKGEDSPVSLIG